MDIPTSTIQKPAEDLLLYSRKVSSPVRQIPNPEALAPIRDYATGPASYDHLIKRPAKANLGQPAVSESAPQNLSVNTTEKARSALLSRTARVFADVAPALRVFGKAFYVLALSEFTLDCVVRTATGTWQSEEDGAKAFRAALETLKVSSDKFPPADPAIVSALSEFRRVGYETSASEEAGHNGGTETPQDSPLPPAQAPASSPASSTFRLPAGPTENPNSGESWSRRKPSNREGNAGKYVSGSNHLEAYFFAR